MDHQLFTILSNSLAVFMRCGVKSVTMDDLSRELHIAKKTMYKHVKDKSDLVCQAMSLYCKSEEQISSALRDSNENAVDELIAITQHARQILNQVHPAILYDLEKYYPNAWEVFKVHKHGFILSCVESNLVRGIEQGLYRENLNVPVISRLYISKIDAMFKEELFGPEYDRELIYSELMRYHIRGIASEKGIKYLQKKIKQINTDL